MDKLPENFSLEKLEWLARYKSREGRAIARRAWERCEQVHQAALAQAVAEAFEAAAMIVYKRFHGMPNEEFRDALMREIRTKAQASAPKGTK